MLTLNIIGAGKLGRTLARLWHQQQVFTIGALCNRTTASSKEARDFIGAGEAVKHITSMPPADLWLIAVPDDDIEPTAIELAATLTHLQQDRPQYRPIVFHCSGALPASVLAACAVAELASAHPAHSFADPERSLADFSGTTVALEGTEQAQEYLEKAFTMLGCHSIRLSPEQKVLYHTGSVMACNYLTVLLELSLQIFAAAGIERDTATRLLAPIVRQTANNNFALGPQRALTGPLVRGDVQTIERQLKALDALPQQHLSQVYRLLGKSALPLAETRLEPATREKLQLLFENPQPENPLPASDTTCD
ncbi:DUF2520 domain-containing protein [Microbulbifer bruguierae]|uniref:DUF2520 domain-containing protein n=1 Tax=Microbulbifer bruguierae TaxID=3029061 RepID=A0ABY8NH64_9GAMM|nr:DUF2520 domain-containing protein [Microbulbifer bruguierae]WGL17749.1 DUF2520 domain-containing protein [Microbulbifer bruguierae]